MVDSYGYDLSYLILVVPAILLALLAQLKVKSAYARYSDVYNMRGLTAAQVAREILDRKGLSHVSIEHIDGELTDCYNSELSCIYLSQGVYDSTSVAALGIAAHEAGHAVQYSDAYAPIRWRNALIPVTNIGATLSWPLILLGIFLSLQFLIYIGIGLFSLAVVFQIVTLPIEFNASRRALSALDECAILAQDELVGARKVLNAAALTYVASLLVSIMNLVRLLSLFTNRKR